jgi:enamine deaminase RidA (YjgF/YER057c/UK114 family)
MNANSKEQLVTREGPRPASAEQRLKELGIKLPAPPEPFGTYAEAVQTGNLLFLTGMLPTESRAAKFIGRVGAELDVEAGRKAAYLAALNVLAVTRQHLGSLDKVTRVVRLGVSVATSGDVREQPKVFPPLWLRIYRRHYGNYKSRNSSDEGGSDSQGGSRFPDCRA